MVVKITTTCLVIVLEDTKQQSMIAWPHFRTIGAEKKNNLWDQLDGKIEKVIGKE
jgi:hypothetical protein